jgi:hypothetical protein
MRAVLRAGSMLSMPAPETLITEPMVLVVHASFATGNAMAQRLMESCLVVLASASAAVSGLERQTGYDVVVLCPYLTADDRDRLLCACAGQVPPPAVLEFCDEPGAMDPHVRTLTVPAPHRSPVQHVLASLSPPA